MGQRSISLRLPRHRFIAVSVSPAPGAVQLL